MRDDARCDLIATLERSETRSFVELVDRERQGERGKRHRALRRVHVILAIKIVSGVAIWRTRSGACEDSCTLRRATRSGRDESYQLECYANGAGRRIRLP